MKSITLLLISFTITVVALMTISPANAKPIVNVQYLNVSNTLTSKVNHYDMINLKNAEPRSLSSNYRKIFSTGLFLSNPAMFSEKNTQVTITRINNSNDFFTNTMVFNDKLHQLISYFTTSMNVKMTGPVVSKPESEVIKKKCNNTLKFN